jgi:hypothetical protein
MPTVVYHGDINLTFIHIPKNGGTSIADWIIEHRKNANIIKFWNHEKLSDLSDVSDLGFKFGVVRNPWDRLVSIYHYLPKMNQHAVGEHVDIDLAQQWMLETNGWKVTYPNFDQWIENFPSYKLTNCSLWTAMTQQHEWFNPGVDLIIRLENIQEDFKKIQELFYSDDPLTVSNITQRNKYQDYYNSKTKDLVASWFREDINLFSYEF